MIKEKEAFHTTTSILNKFKRQLGNCLSNIYITCQAKYLFS